MRIATMLRIATLHFAQSNTFVHCRQFLTRDELILETNHYLYMYKYTLNVHFNINRTQVSGCQQLIKILF